MKSGAGEDPFADLTEKADKAKEQSKNEQEESTNRERTGEKTDTQQQGKITTRRDEGDSKSVHVSETTEDREASDTVSAESKSNRTQVSVDDLPYIARRNVRGASVKTGRDKNVLFELRPEIARREDAFVEELERQIGTDVPKTDAREAALAAIWERPELVVPILEEWGLGYFEE